MISSLCFFQVSHYNFFQMILQRILRDINVHQFRFSSKSALFVSGKNAQKQFAVFTPKICVDWVKSNRTTLETVNQARKVSLDVGNLIHELETYQALKVQIQEDRGNLEQIHLELSERKKRGEDVSDFTRKLKEIKKEMNVEAKKESISNFEESSVLDYLNLQNCNSNSRLSEKPYYCMRREENKFNKINHRDLCLNNDLIEFSPNSHSAYYLKGQLAHLELKLGHFFTSKLLASGLEIFSNPDFVKSVLAEGAGLDIFEASKIFALKKYQDFGDRSSCNAVHLVGGASLAAFSGYFSRNIVMTPQVLPALMFCVGRLYSPLSSAQTDLLSCQQSQALQVLGLTTDQLAMETQLQSLLNIISQIFSSFPNLTITEVSLEDCERSNSRQFRLEVEGVETVTIGHVGVQDSYLSDRMMMVTADNSPLFTVSANINITRLMAVMLELAQDSEAAIQWDLIDSWLA